MKTRREIENDMNIYDKRDSFARHRRLLEVLLDIRELLRTKEDEEEKG